MTIVFVHGVPESDAIWSSLIDALGRDDVICLSPPGFGAPLPAGFGATHTEYRDWLVEQLDGIGTPVDLVGHDWGGGHVVNLLMQRPDLVRSWVTDVIGIFDPEYVWHDLAQVWQTEGAGEDAVQAITGGTVGDRTAVMESLGMTSDIAASVAAAQGPEMGQAILNLYRSAKQPAVAQAGQALENAAARPGLSILATEDSYVGSDDMRRRAADRAGAQTAVLDGLGHWWMIEDPEQGAAVLTRFWESVN